MVMNFWEDPFKCTFTGHQKMEALVPDHVLGSLQSDDTVP